MRSMIFARSNSATAPNTVSESFSSVHVLLAVDDDLLVVLLKLVYDEDLMGHLAGDLVMPKKIDRLERIGFCLFER